jgi:hypothetical protein
MKERCSLGKGSKHGTYCQILPNGLQLVAHIVIVPILLPSLGHKLESFLEDWKRPNHIRLWCLYKRRGKNK